MKDTDCGCSCGCGDSCSDACVTNDAPTSVYACAGASNVGKISFELAMELHEKGHYKMGCSVCVGAGDCGCGGTVTLTGKKDLLLDGCKVACLKTMFIKKGINNFDHVIITQLGVRKEGTFKIPPHVLPQLMLKLAQKGLIDSTQVSSDTPEHTSNLSSAKTFRWRR